MPVAGTPVDRNTEICSGGSVGLSNEAQICPVRIKHQGPPSVGSRLRAHLQETPLALRARSVVGAAAIPIGPEPESKGPIAAVDISPIVGFEIAIFQTRGIGRVNF